MSFKFFADSESRLKYFFFIDIDFICKQVKEIPSYDELRGDPDNPMAYARFFHEAFDLIFVSCDTYTKYLNWNRSASFFGYSLYRQSEEILRYYLMLCLRNHCIIYDFLSRLDLTEVREIHYQNDLQNKTGFFETRKELNSKDYQRPSKQLFHTLATYRLNHYGEKYSMRLFGAQKPLDSKLFVPAPFAAAYDFLFYTNTVSAIDQNLRDVKGQSLWRNYKILQEKYLHRADGTIPRSRHKKEANVHKENIEATRERNLRDDIENSTFKEFCLEGANLLLYSSPMEYWYGFSTFHHILRELNAIEEAEPVTQGKTDLTLRHFSGSPFNSVCTTMLESRLLYSRSFFLDYALGAVLRSRELKSTYLTKENDIAVFKYASRDTSSAENKISRALQAIRQFLDAVNYVTVPLLEDVWSVTMSRIFGEESDSPLKKDLSSIYKSYIDDNIDILTADFTLFDEEEFADCLLPPADPKLRTPEGINNRINMNKLKAYIQVKKGKATLKYMDAKPADRKTWTQLLFDYLSVDHVRFKKRDVLPGYINHSTDRDSSYQLKLNDYFQDTIFKRILLYGEGRPDC